MRLILAALLILGGPLIASAQTSTSSLAPVPPLPTIGLPLPEISGSFKPSEPSIFERPGPKTPPPSRHTPGGGRRPRGRHPSSVVYVPVYPWGVAPGAPASSYATQPEERADTVPLSEVENLKDELKADIAQLKEELKNERTATTSADAPPPPPPSTFYYIPGCYMGNVPPSQVTLPANCDPKQVITRKP
jgi:hypothetical protein